MSYWSRGFALRLCSGQVRHYLGLADLCLVSGADWYLKLSSQYKRSAGRNLGDTRHGISSVHAQASIVKKKGYNWSEANDKLYPWVDSKKAHEALSHWYTTCLHTQPT
ncbi:hypothetical protein P5673_005809 [Acropora cervicornis]|uniref:Uncharacterized protein n=1 Tax=Acropora cervicornis TaxID=6130 RepID=A0AAD9QZ52_ACRCE|nr:hypothetical protein P5673_005809 [Acropora cervicornis]